MTPSQHEVAAYVMHTERWNPGTFLERLYPVDVLMRQFLEEIERAQRHEPIVILREHSQLGDPLGFRVHERMCTLGFRNRSSVATGQQIPQRDDRHDVCSATR